MRVVLEVTSGPAAGRKIWLQAGQVAEIGVGGPEWIYRSWPTGRCARCTLR